LSAEGTATIRHKYPELARHVLRYGRQPIGDVHRAAIARVALGPTRNRNSETTWLPAGVTHSELTDAVVEELAERGLFRKFVTMNTIREGAPTRPYRAIDGVYGRHDYTREYSGLVLPAVGMAAMRLVRAHLTEQTEVIMTRTGEQSIIPDAAILDEIITSAHKRTNTTPPKVRYLEYDVTGIADIVAPGEQARVSSQYDLMLAKGKPRVRVPAGNQDILLGAPH
jgi:hypothetical protein